MIEDAPEMCDPDPAVSRTSEAQRSGLPAAEFVRRACVIALVFLAMNLEALLTSILIALIAWAVSVNRKVTATESDWPIFASQRTSRRNGRTA